jgi:uncharacterized protein
MIDDGPYHAGARSMQERAGVVAQADRNARAVRSDVPDVAAAFLAEQPFVVVGSVDTAGRVWCSLLTGRPGFVRAVGDRVVALAAHPAPGDPLEAVVDGDPVGLLAIEPTSRRRMRVNGSARTATIGHLFVDVDEVISNCPKWITRRDVGALDRPAPPMHVTGAVLTPGQADLVRAADTFFLATTAPGAGVDASHRGGAPGFVTVVGDDRLVWPDLPGNAMFLSLGNVELDPHAGVLVVDWTTGATLQLTGRAHVVWRGADERVVVFDVDEVRQSDI